MVLSEKLKAEISAIFRKIEYGKVSFHISPEKKTLDYTVETTHKMPIDRPCVLSAGKPPQIKVLK
ncbi:MAG: hypothetical protein LBH43_10980 [Treponema sp.]|jgi:hypothetical protein|nr:hypothetical protein [Treponema sp.]